MNFKKLFYFLAALAVMSLVGCMDNDPYQKEEISGGTSPRGLFIINEGNFMYGNASLSFYDPEAKTIENDIFFRSNGFKLGDVAQSMTIRDSLGYVVVNNSGVIFVINVNTFKIVGKITGLMSPRYIHFVRDDKAYVTDLYVTDLYAYTIAVVNPKTLQVTKRINVQVQGKEQPSTEQMVQYENYVFTNCWSYDNRILVIDTNTDTVVDAIEVGIQPTSLAIDKYNKIWAITDGGYPGSPYGYEAPALYRIDAKTRKIEKTFSFKLGEQGSEICLNGTRDTLYFVNKHIWKMNVQADELPKQPFLENKSTHYWYGLTVDPQTSEVYLADAIDYSQSGRVYRYSPQGMLVDDFQVGIIPGTFCFRAGTHGQK